MEAPYTLIRNTHIDTSSYLEGKRFEVPSEYAKMLKVVI
jgi:hypothetical protein